QQWIMPKSGAAVYRIHIGNDSRDLQINCTTAGECASGITNPEEPAETTTSATRPTSTTVITTTSSTSSTSTTSAQPTTTTAAPPAGNLPRYSQCGGIGWQGSGSCVSGTTCTKLN